MMTPAIRQSTRLVQGALSLVYPTRCGLCSAPVVEGFALCAECFAETRFLGGLTCDLCGTPLPGESDAAERCDDCMALARPWTQGRAAVGYSGSGRKLVLRLKYGDRLELARLAAAWMVAAGEDVLDGRTLVPVPIHWSRRISRRYNQSVELSRAIARRTGLDHHPRALARIRPTPPQDRKTVEERFANVDGSIIAHRPQELSDRRVCLVDDVMTSGSTLAACAHAALDAGARDVSVLVLARVVKRP